MTLRRTLAEEAELMQQQLSDKEDMKEEESRYKQLRRKVMEAEKTLEKKKYDEAVGMYEAILAREGDSDFFGASNCFLGLGIAWLNLSEAERALVNLQKGIELDELGSPGLYLYKAKALVKLKRGEEALKTLEDAIELFDHDLEEHVQFTYFAGQLCEEVLHDDDKALSYYNKSIELVPLYSQLHCSVASVLARMGKAEESRQALEKALECEPVWPEAYYQMSVVAEDKEVSDEMLQKYVETRRIVKDWKHD